MNAFVGWRKWHYHHRHEVTAMPEAVIPNGMTALDKTQGLVLIEDGKLGAIWKPKVKDWRIRD
jgi:hypothetical protein